MNAADAGLIAATGYVVGLIGWILWDASRRPERNERKDERTMNLRSTLRALWHRIVPRRHHTPEQLMKIELERRLRWRVDSRLERAIRANRLPAEDARAVRREYKRLIRSRGADALQLAVNYAATLAPPEQERTSW